MTLCIPLNWQWIRPQWVTAIEHDDWNDDWQKHLLHRPPRICLCIFLHVFSLKPKPTKPATNHYIRLYLFFFFNTFYDVFYFFGWRHSIQWSSYLSRCAYCACSARSHMRQPLLRNRALSSWNINVVYDKIVAKSFAHFRWQSFVSTTELWSTHKTVFHQFEVNRKM